MQRGQLARLVREKSIEAFDNTREMVRMCMAKHFTLLGGVSDMAEEMESDYRNLIAHGVEIFAFGTAPSTPAVYPLSSNPPAFDSIYTDSETGEVLSCSSPCLSGR
jgi:hypothetical protein